MIKTFTKAKEDFYMISYYLNMTLDRMHNRTVVNRVRIDMNKKIEQLIIDCL
jgi:hypothetical protein